MARPRIASPRRQTWRRNFKLNSRGSSAASTLQSAGAYLNRQLAFYGEAQDRIAAATDLAQKFQTQQQGQLSGLHAAIGGRVLESAARILWRGPGSHRRGDRPGAEISNSTAGAAQQPSRCRHSHCCGAVVPIPTGSAGGTLGRSQYRPAKKPVQLSRITPENVMIKDFEEKALGPRPVPLPRSEERRV